LDIPTFERLSECPNDLLDLVRALLDGTQSIVIDELQRVPALLNVIQQLMSETKIQFALSGTSAFGDLFEQCDLGSKWY
jgi:predicted AAA+ superfamily ATPase